MSSIPERALTRYIQQMKPKQKKRYTAKWGGASVLVLIMDEAPDTLANFDLVTEMPVQKYVLHRYDRATKVIELG